MTRLQFVKARLLAPSPGIAWSLIWSASALAAPTFVRWVLDPFVTGITYITYYPFVLLVAMTLGWRYAMGVVLLAAAMADFLFVDPRYTISSEASDWVSGLIFVSSSALMIAVAETLRRTLRELEEGLEREAALNAELDHRVRNILTVVEGLAAQSLKGELAHDDAVRTFRGRLHALASAHEVLTSGRSLACELPHLAERALAPFIAHGAVTVSGPDCQLPEASAVPLVLALHELGTNAVKYGALSAPAGQVDVSWSLRAHAKGHDLILRWCERGGPAVSPPKRRGLGSRLLRAQHGLDDVTVGFDPAGVTCDVRIDGARPLAPEPAPVAPAGFAAPASLLA
jgi:two-component sensor histidine kinase